MIPIKKGDEDVCIWENCGGLSEKASTTNEHDGRLAGQRQFTAIVPLFYMYFRGLWYGITILIEFFKKLEKSKWLQWVGTAPFILIPIAIMFGGEVSRGAGILAFFASMWVGIALGGKFAHFVATHFLKASEDMGKHISAGGCAFGFLFLPVLVGSFANSYLGTSIEIRSLGAHFLWACVGAVIFFFLSSKFPANGS